MNKEFKHIVLVRGHNIDDKTVVSKDCMIDTSKLTKEGLIYIHHKHDPNNFIGEITNHIDNSSFIDISGIIWENKINLLPKGVVKYTPDIKVIESEIINGVRYLTKIKIKSICAVAKY
jgi:hypothetical protein